MTRRKATLEHVTEDESLSYLAQVLAHRLRGLVAGIEGFTDLLTDTLATTEQRELALRIMEGASRIETVLADLQLYGESFEPVMLPVRTDEVVRDLLAPLPETDAARVDVTVSDPAAGRMLIADPFLLRQALLVLIQNALEAQKEGGRVRVEPTLDGSTACFNVWNAGTISGDAPERTVFTPFYTTKAHNLGVGLSIARRIARMHDGTLELSENSLERGTQFTLRIPEPDDTYLT